MNQICENCANWGLNGLSVNAKYGLLGECSNELVYGLFCGDYPPSTCSTFGCNQWIIRTMLPPKLTDREESFVELQEKMQSLQGEPMDSKEFGEWIFKILGGIDGED